MFSANSGGYYNASSDESMTYTQQQQQVYAGSPVVQQAPQGPATPPRRRMNNPYSAKNPVRMVSATSSSTPIMSPISHTAPRSSSSQQFLASNVTAIPAMESLAPPQQQQQQQQQKASGSSSSGAASSTDSIAPLVMPAPASAATVVVTNNTSEVSTPTKHNNQQASSAAAPNAYSGMTADEMLADITGRTEADILALARTANGSSTLQTAIKGDPRCATHLWQHLSSGPALGELMLDAHGGYVIRALLDSVPRDTAREVCAAISKDTRLAYSLCTHSLHTRRLVQGIMEAHDPDFLSGVLAEMCDQIARTQQGCIVMQRALDHSTSAPRAALVQSIAKHIGGFCADPFANYVVQYLLDSAPREEVVPMLWSALRGRVLEMSCNKFSSNVIEKFLTLADPQSQHELIVELYTSQPEALCHVMQDSFGNYIVQATIARSTFADLTFIDGQLRPILEHVPYGSKIAARLDRRLNPNAQQQMHHGGGGGGGRHHYHNQQQQQQQQQQMMGQHQQQGYYPRGGPRRGGYHQMQQQQQMQMQQQVQQQAQQHHHAGAGAMTYYTTPATAAW